MYYFYFSFGYYFILKRQFTHAYLIGILLLSLNWVILSRILVGVAETLSEFNDFCT